MEAVQGDLVVCGPQVDQARRLCPVLLPLTFPIEMGEAEQDANLCERCHLLICNANAFVDDVIVVHRGRHVVVHQQDAEHLKVVFGILHRRERLVVLVIIAAVSRHQGRSPGALQERLEDAEHCELGTEVAAKEGATGVTLRFAVEPTDVRLPRQL